MPRAYPSQWTRIRRRRIHGTEGPGCLPGRAQAAHTYDGVANLDLVTISQRDGLVDGVTIAPPARQVSLRTRGAVARGFGCGRGGAKAVPPTFSVDNTFATAVPAY